MPTPTDRAMPRLMVSQRKCKVRSRGEVSTVRIVPPCFLDVVPINFRGRENGFLNQLLLPWRLAFRNRSTA
ncbi:hypothetical protein D3C72_1925850 [compost metagenome]